MCLWADQPGGGTEATQDSYALAVLQEVLHGVSVHVVELERLALDDGHDMVDITQQQQ